MRASKASTAIEPGQVSQPVEAKGAGAGGLFKPIALIKHLYHQNIMSLWKYFEVAKLL